MVADITDFDEIFHECLREREHVFGSPLESVADRDDVPEGESFPFCGGVSFHPSVRGDTRPERMPLDHSLFPFFAISSVERMLPVSSRRRRPVHA